MNMEKCQISKVGPFKACQKNATATRWTGKVKIQLCDKHDERYGKAIGQRVVVVGTWGPVDALVE